MRGNKSKRQPGNNDITLTIENVRCFSEEQHFNIRPLTFLVGENSTGKTTVMGCFNIITDLITKRLPPDFNREPYCMGSFQDIVTKKQTKAKNKEDETFKISFELNEPKYKYDIYFVRKKKFADPVIQKVKIDSKNTVFYIDNESQELSIKYKKDQKNSYTFEVPDKNFAHSLIRDPYRALRILYWEAVEGKNKKSRKNTLYKEYEKHMKRLEEMDEELFRYRRHFHNIINLAPIRSKPRRTYDPVREIPNPEGSEIPVTLMRLNKEEQDWKQMHQKLIKFGKASGLFSDVKVKQYGESIGDPFQLHFQIRDFESNIMDVGYGVSQILPLLVRLFYPERKPKDLHRRWFPKHYSENKFLLQQPEVHLHPKAQAEFASLLIESIEKQGNSFLIETHSDYMIDRTSIEIRNKNISHEDVSLIYLEPIEGGGVKAHNMSFDKDGNLKSAPKGYRDFFISESNRFLGFGD